MATLPHSEHSFKAIRSLLRIVDVILKYAGSEGDGGGCAATAELCISVSAATVLATT